MNASHAMTILTVVGARPQFVKASAISSAMTAAGGVTELLVHTGQHSDDDMSGVFFRELGLRTPDVDLGVSGGLHGEMTARMLAGLESVMIAHRPDAVVVYGDTNSTLAGALAAAKLSIPLVHVEAGLRSFNRAMPEETNRVLTDHVSTLLCCPTQTAVDNLAREGFSGIVAGGDLVGAAAGLAGAGPWVANVGDVMLDVLRRHRDLAATSTILNRLSLDKGGYGVLTIHRAENASRVDTLRQLLGPVREVSRLLPIVFVVHPRTRALAVSAGEPDMGLRDSAVTAVDPLSYLDFLHLQANAKIILTDSGGVQKEACFLGVPCLTLRDETEWPETVAAGCNTVVGSNPGDLTPAFRKALANGGGTSQAFGKGDAAARIVNLMLASLGR